MISRLSAGSNGLECVFLIQTKLHCEAFEKFTEFFMLLLANAFLELEGVSRRMAALDAYQIFLNI